MKITRARSVLNNFFKTAEEVKPQSPVPEPELSTDCGRVHPGRGVDCELKGLHDTHQFSDPKTGRTHNWTN